MTDTRTLSLLTRTGEAILAHDREQKAKPEGLRLVVIASPFRGERAVNMDYLRECIRDTAERGEAAFAPHATYPLAFDDDIPEERELSIRMGCAWQDAADALVVYIDLGVSKGMEAEIAHAHRNHQTVEYRRLGKGGRAA